MVESSETFSFLPSCCVEDRQTLRFGWRGRREGVDGVTFELVFPRDFERQTVQKVQGYRLPFILTP